MYVYVTYDPVLEKVVCVHDKPNKFCKVCGKINKRRIKINSFYHLYEKKMKIKTGDELWK
jgi:translation initiation factor IF-1